MAEIDFRKICMRFQEALGMAFIERIERRIGQDFKEALEEKSEELLISILQDVQLYYITPFEMVIDLASYLREVHQISKFSVSLSEIYDLVLSRRLEEASGIVKAFYDMTSSLGLAHMFEKKRVRWWRSEF